MPFPLESHRRAQSKWTRRSLTKECSRRFSRGCSSTETGFAPRELTALGARRRIWWIGEGVAARPLALSAVRSLVGSGVDVEALEQRGCLELLACAEEETEHRYSPPC